MQKNDHPGSSSEEDMFNATDLISEAVQPAAHPLMEDQGAHATKGDTMDLISNICTFFADLALVQEELTAVTGRVKATEDDVSSLSQKQVRAVEQLQCFQILHSAVQTLLDTLDNTKSLKIRGLTESIADREIPHWTRESKNNMVDNYYQLPKSPRAPAAAPCHVLLPDIPRQMGVLRWHSNLKSPSNSRKCN
ncbi:Hypothetical predicted protein [Pelobates cultripes]|uniref:Uncharacterized protein n=1 Tax=Pelobates cultripes TaxID=61616 RepID=A0AAD1S883_PELCU|nr:Hypothetical predicted protein [Pelobates cultripes]